MSKDISKLQDQVTKRLFGKTDWSKRGLSGPAVLHGVTLDGRLGGGIGPVAVERGAAGPKA